MNPLYAHATDSKRQMARGHNPLEPTTDLREYQRFRAHARVGQEAGGRVARVITDRKVLFYGAICVLHSTICQLAITLREALHTRWMEIAKGRDQVSFWNSRGAVRA